VAMLHVKSWEAVDDISAYDIVSYRIPQKVDLYIGHLDGRFKLFKAEGKARNRLPVTLKEGHYTQVKLAEIYLIALERRVA